MPGNDSTPSITLFSLTDMGYALARRLLTLAPQAEHLHRPQPFAETVQAHFNAGHRIVLITAMGIAVRSLAPVLQNKYSDPAVLVMDDRGRFIIPLLSGHEGGANAWAQTWADQLDMSCVITSARTYTQPLYVAGIGCERNCPMEVICELADTTLKRYAMSIGQLNAVASIHLKANEPGLLAFADALILPRVFFDATILNQYEHRLTQRSDIVFRETGCYGVAEAAALAQAERMSGTGAELIIPKHKNAQATFALARTYLEIPS